MVQPREFHPVWTMTKRVSRGPGARRLIAGRPYHAIIKIAEINVKTVRVTRFITRGSRDGNAAQFRSAAPNFAEAYAVVAVRKYGRVGWEFLRRIWIACHPNLRRIIGGNKFHGDW